ncbi:SDR family oxidoreductase [Undibacterium sp. CY18W]|uniref:SDR family oxidoreductase n=1 Tax=Undibacterium hunanense TaxID=2762292 RepID=A0ABR6ZX87_9BURK|nr:SDR family oxidoreductase [Undibacterium hunanense]MBC3920175.1 SDR family oxidoreductase [Undibacterium hunanense]
MPVALIIGASRGIGQELAMQYKAAGWRVIATARKEEDLAALQSAGCEALPLDVTNLNDCAGLGWRLDDEKLDVAILNAGMFGPRTSGLTTPDQQQFDAVMHTNVLAAMRILPIVLPLVEHARGRLAVLSSGMASIGERSNPAGWLYRASKTALNSVLKDVSLSTDKAICVAMDPGWVQTDMGGSGAEITVDVSVAGIRQTLAALKPADNGKYLQYTGAEHGW